MKFKIPSNKIRIWKKSFSDAGVIVTSCLVREEQRRRETASLHLRLVCFLNQSLEMLIQENAPSKSLISKSFSL
ncbi:hypothetical protein ABID47_002692 [Paenibacillus favisporus]|uniref:Uncharacterized protein n=1 Tax=Paenibacillus favisporus TaxID=221028 RepID=A0ABV2F2U8_9BACL